MAGGIIGAAAGKLFNEVMEAIGVGGPDLVAKLDKISDQLVQVQRSLDRLTEMTTEILKQLSELRDFMEKSLKIETLVAAMTRIEVAYGSPSGETLLRDGPAGRAISLRLLTEKMPHFDGITAKELEAAGKEFAAYVSDMPDRIETIHGVLAKAAFGQVSLLTHWAKELGQQVKAGKIEREAAYLVLEGYFLQAVSVQLKGVSVHCVALGTDRLGLQFIHEFLQDNFAKTVASETAAFVEAVELLLFSSLAPSMTVGMGDGLGEREFPKHVDELLLRADLLAAALNLVGRKPDAAGKPPVSMQAAIQGIYGRVLLPPSQLSGGAPPAIAPRGYAPAAGTAVRALAFPCLDLVEKDGRAVLNDAASSAVTVAHYYWPFPTPAPAAGTPIDPGQRGGVTPAGYPVFGVDHPPVLAASLFDVSRLYRGLPPGAQQSYKFTEFPGGYDDLGFPAQKCTSARHPLTNSKDDAFQHSFTAAAIYRANIVRHSYVVHRLFNYSGGPAKVRLTAHTASVIRRDARKDGQRGTAFGQDYDVTDRLKLRLVNGWEKEFYNSVTSFGRDQPLSNRGSDAYSSWRKDWEARRDGFFSVDFDLVAGDYELVLDSEVYYFEAPKRFEGWQSISLFFALHGLSIERV